MKIGVMVESFQVGLDDGLKAAAEVGADGVQMYATEGDVYPDNIDAGGRKELLAKVNDLGLDGVLFVAAMLAPIKDSFGDLFESVIGSR